MLTLFTRYQQTFIISKTVAKHLLAASILVASSFFVSCGQTGPLVLPEKPDKKTTTAPTTAPTKKTN